MNVKELIEQLQQIDEPDRKVILSIDPEGNGFQEVEDIQTIAYHPKYEETKLEELTPELKKRGYTEDDLPQGEGWEKAVCLWP